MSALSIENNPCTPAVRHSRSWQLRAGTLATASLIAVSGSVLSTAPAVAQSAAPVAAPAALGSAESVIADFQRGLNSLSGNIAEGAWNLRQSLVGPLAASGSPLANPVREGIDSILNAIFPGLVARKTAPPAPVAPPVAPKPAAPAFNTGPCPVDARVCVDIDGRRTWLQDGKGTVTYVSTAMSPGKPGQETPRGTFAVTRKVKDEVSYLFNNAPMPYAVYFTNRGHAFHEGNPAFDSAGCVRLPHQDAVKYFDSLQVGDKVVIF